MGVWRSGSVIRQASKPVVRSVSIIHKQLVSIHECLCACMYRKHSIRTRTQDILHRRQRTIVNTSMAGFCFYAVVLVVVIVAWQECVANSRNTNSRSILACNTSSKKMDSFLLR